MQPVVQSCILFAIGAKINLGYGALVWVIPGVSLATLQITLTMSRVLVICGCFYSLRYEILTFDASPNAGGYNCAVTSIIEMVSTIATDGAQGGWNDMDMLEVGNGAQSDSEYVVHFSMCRFPFPRSDSS
jgi:hypothetical protein